MPTIADFRARLPSLEGLDDTQALMYLQQRYAPDVPVEALAQRLGVKVAAPEVKQPKRGLMALANDTVIEAANAAAGTVGAVGDFISPGNSVSKFIDERIIRPGEESQSDVVKADKAKFRADMESAGGMGDEVAAVGRYVAGSPLLALAQAAGSFAVPGVAIKGAGALAGAAGAGAKGVTRAGLAGGAALGAAGAGGDAAGTAYDLAIQGGATEEQAQAAARQASAIPAAIGGLGGVVGAERLVAGAKGFGGGLMARALKTAGVEGAQEGIEEGVTQYEGQRAAVPFNPGLDPMKGAAGAAALGAVLGAATGGGVALLERQQAAADKGLEDLKAARDPESIVDAALRATDVPLVVAPEGITADGEILPPGTKPRARNASAIEEIRQLDTAQQEEALGLLATAQSPRTSPAVRRYAQNRLDVLLQPVRQIPVGEVIEEDPLPVGETQELTSTEATSQILQPPTLAQRNAMGKRLPVGDATELEPDQIELETIPTPDVIEAGGDLPPPEGMAPRTPKKPEPAPASPMTEADIVAAVVDGFRKTNTPQARAFVQDFDAGRIKPADVLALVGRPPMSPDERIAAAAAQAPKPDPNPLLLTADGQPYGTRSGAYVRAKREGLGSDSIITVPGGWAVQPKESASEQPDMARATSRPDRPGDGRGAADPRGGGNLRPDPDSADGAVRTGPTPAPRSGGGTAVAVAPGGGPDAALSPLATAKVGDTIDVVHRDSNGALRVAGTVLSVEDRGIWIKESDGRRLVNRSEFGNYIAAGTEEKKTDRYATWTAYEGASPAYVTIIGERDGELEIDDGYTTQWVPANQVSRTEDPFASEKENLKRIKEISERQKMGLHTDHMRSDGLAATGWSAESAENAANAMIPPVVRGMSEAAQKSAEGLRERVADVRLGPIEGERETITFTFDGKPHKGILKGRNADLVVAGDGRESDRAVAVRVMLDGDAKPLTPLQARRVAAKAGNVERETSAPATPEAAIRAAVQEVQNRVIGSWFPVTVTHGGKTQQFLSNIKRVVSDGKGPQAIHLTQIRPGRLMAGDQVKPLIYSYKLTREDDLVEEGIPREPSDAETARWTAAFGAPAPNAAAPADKAPPTGRVPEAAAPSNRTLKEELDSSYKVANQMFGNDIVSAGIQNDWQNLLDAAESRDVEKLASLEQKYLKDEGRDGMGVGTAGAGPGKVKQSRRGAAQLARFARALRGAIERAAPAPTTMKERKASAPKPEPAAEPAAPTADPTQLPVEYKAIADFIDAVDRGGVPLNPKKAAELLRATGAEVSKSARPEEVIDRLRAALARARQEAGMTDQGDAAEPDNQNPEPPLAVRIRRREVEREAEAIVAEANAEDARRAAPTDDPFAADYAALVGKTIEQTVTTDDGKTAILRMDAARAMRDFDQREKTLAELKACLGRNG